MKRISIVAMAFCALSWGNCSRAIQISAPKRVAFGASSSVERAFKNKASDVQVEDEGVVIRLLSDDLVGGRHQRFVVRLTSGQTVLVAHNIDIAPRVSGLKESDHIRFCGEYVWNEKGGLVHWTHRDPQGRHAAGWLRHDGRIYQ